MLQIREEKEGGLVLYERGEPEFDQAWDALIATGKDPNEWMYMDTKELPRLRFHGFKHIETRQYVRIVQVLEAASAFVEDLGQ